MTDKPRRVATLEQGHELSTVATATGRVACPWLESYGYHHAIAPRGRRSFGFDERKERAQKNGVSTEIIILICTTVSGFLAAAIGWFKWWHELQEKRWEKAEKDAANSAKQRAETALADATRRAADTSPYFMLSKERFNGVEVPTANPWESKWYSPGDPSLLCYARNEVERTLPAEEPIYLLIENHGSDAFEISIQLAGEPVSFVEVKAGHQTLYAFRYAYHPERHGSEETIKLSFLAANGFRDTHAYATAHGFRSLKRIDPA